MKGDFSRRTFDPVKRYRGVLMQQGRVQLDSDWNEQVDIERYLQVTETLDVIGGCGAPKHQAGFKVTPTPDGEDLLISPGRFYVEGRMCELFATWEPAVYADDDHLTVGRWHLDNAGFTSHQYVELAAQGQPTAIFRVTGVDPDDNLLTLTPKLSAFQNVNGLRVRRLTTYLTQPDLPEPPYSAAGAGGDPPVLELPKGTYLLYLDAWARHITALDDGLIQEKALGGPDTATRAKGVWQLKLWPGPNQDPLDPATSCPDEVGGFDAATSPSTGLLLARTKEPPDTDDPCLLPPSAGYLGLENQQYRVEIHRGGTLGTDEITFKWSRDNGSVVKALTPIPGSTAYTVSSGPDDYFSLSNGQWVEQVDDETELKGLARDLFQFQKNNATGEVTLAHPLNEDLHPQLRRWENDQTTVPSPPGAGGGWMDLELGVQIRFEEGTTYRTGDYWTIPARTVLGDIEWPEGPTGVPVPQPAQGISHGYCRIGVLHNEGETPVVEDCRTIFPPLNELDSRSSCCSFTVGDGLENIGDFTFIQDAVDALPDEGGEVCILPGRYIQNVIVKDRKNVHLSGCGDRTVIATEEDTPVLYLTGSENVMVTSLAIEAAGKSPGILADEESPCGGIVIREVSIRSNLNSGIKIRDAEGVVIERCFVEMSEPATGWPAIFLRASGGDVLNNEVVGPEREVSFLRVKGSFASSALQLGGGSERIRVLDNHFHDCTGQGITLGSLILLDSELRPVVEEGSGGGLRWVSDLNDPCADCGEVGTGGIDEGGTGSPGGSDETLESEGDLVDIDIAGNRLFRLGLDGIGVVRFFNSREGRLSVRVEDLKITGNRIEHVVGRPVAAIPQVMVDLMAYGGIALAIVEGLVVRDNFIVDIGCGGRLPVVGVFVLYGEGLEFGRNQIHNRTPTFRGEEVKADSGRRGGIHVVMALGRGIGASKSGLFEKGGQPLNVADYQNAGRSESSIVVEENTVEVSAGQALSVTTLGSASVFSNRFATRDTGEIDLFLFLRSEMDGGLGKALARLPYLVAILSLGRFNRYGANIQDTGSNVSSSNQAVRGTDLSLGRFVQNLFQSGGNVLFADNQCWVVVGGSSESPLALRGAAAHASGKMLRPSILILSMDEVGFLDNQAECQIGGGTMPCANVVAGLLSQRMASNRLKETLGRALYSGVSFGIMNVTGMNQSDHCIRVLGAVRDEPANQQFVELFDADYCANSLQQAGEIARALVGSLQG